MNKNRKKKNNKNVDEKFLSTISLFDQKANCKEEETEVKEEKYKIKAKKKRFCNAKMNRLQ